MPADALQQRMLTELLSIPDLAGAVDDLSSLGYFSIVNPPSDVFLVYAALYTVILLAAGLLAIRRKTFKGLSRERRTG